MGEIRLTWDWNREWDNPSESNSDGIALSVKGKCSEVSWILDHVRGIK